jgi:hypothetical protein
MSDRKGNSFYDRLTLRNGKNDVVIVVVNWRSCEWDIISFIPPAPHALVALTITFFNILYS